MNGIRAVFSIVLIFAALAAVSQQNDSVKVRLNHYTLTVGAGWTHYINNLEYGDENIKNDFAGVSFKFFWEPEHRLSLGLGTGYYKLFRIKGEPKADTAVQIDRSLVPFLLLVRMRIVDHVYLGAGMGLSFITNKVASSGREIVTKTTSLANFEVAGSYIYPLGKHWLVGGELKVFHSGTLEDWLYSVQATCAFKL
jgi:hypothetical protein